MSDVFHSDMDFFLKLSLSDLFLNHDTDAFWVHVENLSSSSMIELVWHSLVNGSIDYNVNVISLSIFLEIVANSNSPVSSEGLLELMFGSRSKSPRCSHVYKKFNFNYLFRQWIRKTNLRQQTIEMKASQVLRSTRDMLRWNTRMGISTREGLSKERDMAVESMFLKTKFPIKGISRKTCFRAKVDCRSRTTSIIKESSNGARKMGADLCFMKMETDMRESG